MKSKVVDKVREEYAIQIAEQALLADRLIMAHATKLIPEAKTGQELASLRAVIGDIMRSYVR